MPTKPKATPCSQGQGVSQLSEKSLSSLMKVELLADKTKQEVGDIWRQYHANKDAVAAVIPADMWASMTALFEEHKTFLFPLPRKEGYEFVVVQFQGKEAHFTTLINYQVKARLYFRATFAWDIRLLFTNATSDHIRSPFPLQNLPYIIK